MRKIYNILSKICAKLDKAILSVSAVLLGFLTLLIFVQVICRYVFHNSLSWSEEIARYLEVWIVFISGAYALGRGQHVAMDLVISKVPKKVAGIMRKFHALMFIALSIFMFNYSVQFMIAEKAQTMASLVWLPKNLAYLAMPIGSAFMLIYSLMLLVAPGEEVAA